MDQKGLTLFPKHSGLLLAYVWMCMDVHDHHRAEKALNALPDEVAEEPVWTAVRSRLSIHTGNVNEAADLAEKLLKQENSSIRAMGHYHKGRALMEKEISRKRFNISARLKSWFHLGRIRCF